MPALTLHLHLRSFVLLLVGCLAPAFSLCSFSLCSFSLCSFSLCSFSLCSDALGEEYQHGPDSMPNDSVAHGKVTQHQWLESKVFPGTQRHYSVYVPAQYDGSQPAALMVFQDGHAYVGEQGQFRVPIVFDNLIHEGAMPVTIATTEPTTRASARGRTVASVISCVSFA
jgi:hypothetical protein